MHPILNFLMDEAGLNRGKVKVTYYNPLNKAEDLRCKIENGRLMLKKVKAEQDIASNPVIAGGPIWARGPRYIAFAGHPETINPNDWVRQHEKGVTQLEVMGRSELLEVGAETARLLASKQKVDMQKIIAYLVLGVAALIVMLMYFGTPELEAIKETLTTMAANIEEIKTAVVVSAQQ